MIRVGAVERATGWRIHVHETLGSTNDEAARLRDTGRRARTAVVATQQTAGRGRTGSWSSPPGGLYLSLLVGAHDDDLPGPLTAALALACAEAVEHVAPDVACLVKWPNDLWVGRRKLAGLLLETTGASYAVVAGIGLNLARVPDELPDDIRGATTALSVEASRPVTRTDLLEAILLHVDLHVAALRVPAGREALEVAWRSRLALLGDAVTYELGDRHRRGILEDASLERGLLVLDDEEGRIWRRPEHVREVRPAAGP